MDDDTTAVWNVYEVGNGDLVVCEEGNPDGWLRSDVVVTAVDAAGEPRESRRPAHE